MGTHPLHRGGSANSVVEANAEILLEPGMSLAGDAKTLALQAVDPAECDEPSEQRPARRTGEVRRTLSRVRVVPNRLSMGWDSHGQVVQESPPFLGKPVSTLSASRIRSSAGRFEMA